MKIDVLCNDGSPLGVSESTIYGDNFRVGVGGAELALLTMCRIWKEDGHDVVLYNDPRNPTGSCFEQRAISSFSANEKRDFLIVFRSPNPRAIPAKGKKIWWSCDQYTVGSFADFAGYVDKIVCISPFHADYFSRAYGITDAVVIDLPVRLDEVKSGEKVKNHMVFTSVPDRGLQHLWRIYPRIRASIPDLTLTITSDYRLWGASELNQQHRGRWIVHDGVDFLGALPRKRYLEEIAKAELMVYPGIYPELFCISVAEAQAAGVVCVTTATGALSTTNMGHIFAVNCEDVRNDNVLVERAIDVLRNRVAFEQSQQAIMELARMRFSPERIRCEWNKLVFGV